MKFKQDLLALGIIICLAAPGFSTEKEQAEKVENGDTSKATASVKDPDAALGDYEENYLAMFRKVGEWYEAKRSEDNLKIDVQQRDLDCRVEDGAPGCAEEVSPLAAPKDYLSAIKDTYYGYQVVILVDKTVASAANRLAPRNGSTRQAQTMYVFVREGEQFKFKTAFPVSTGREPTPGSRDTREGYMRVQSAQKDYVSATYGEAMPWSMFFESEYGTAIHQTRKDWCTNMIGMRASAGCIRLCEDAARPMFELVTKYGSTADRFRRVERLVGTNAIVMLHKRNGNPVALGQFDRTGAFANIRTTEYNAKGEVSEKPKVIRGFPAFVRVIDTKDRSGRPVQEKIDEVESILKNPTEGLKRYFKKVSPSVINSVNSATSI